MNNNLHHYKLTAAGNHVKLERKDAHGKWKYVQFVNQAQIADLLESRRLGQCVLLDLRPGHKEESHHNAEDNPKAAPAEVEEPLVRDLRQVCEALSSAAEAIQVFLRSLEE